jgi:uncharacterized membrane protein YeaQ/YmgE (transglycosylase-associated protein family)
MSILLFIVFGFVIGLLARAVMPGEQKMGLAMTTGLGMAGSFIGGFIGSLLTDSRVTDLNTAGFIGSLVGALVLLAVAAGIGGRRQHPV